VTPNLKTAMLDLINWVSSRSGGGRDADRPSSPRSDPPGLWRSGWRRRGGSGE